MSTKKTDVDQQFIRDLAGILNDTNLTELEVELGELKVRVARHAAPVHAYAQAMPAPMMPALAAPGWQPRRLPSPVDPSKNAVPSPMVGTAYLSPSPGCQGLRRGWPVGA